MILDKFFEGPYTCNQRFGENKAVYKPFGLNGHNGLDYPLPIGTAILAPADGIVSSIVNDHEKGYGLCLRVLVWEAPNFYELIFAHLSQTLINVNFNVHSGWKIAHSGNSGFCTSGGKVLTPDMRKRGLGAHLHFGVRQLDANRQVLDYANGFKGAIDPWQFLKDKR